jgi:Mn2+/Fe2+ NRAMP family transporter
MRNARAAGGFARFRSGRRRIAIGPGAIAAASDNDPTTVGSLAVVGATTRYSLCWLVVLVVPMLVIVQSVAARVGAVARRGLEDVVRDRYGRPAALLIMLLVLAVNVFTIGADLSGGAAALGLLLGDGGRWLILPLAAFVAGLLTLGTYGRVQNVIRVPMLVFVAYIASAVIAQPDWGDVLRHTFVPSFSSSSDYIDGALALLGTTLTAYAYFWESISSAKEMSIERVRAAQLDAAVGMVAAGVVIYFIVVSTGATLGVHHEKVNTAADAARALQPFAGAAASALFGIGLLASALLALPVLAATSAYVLSDALEWKGDLDDGVREARAFYAAMLIVVAAGAVVALGSLSAIKLLFYSSIAGGLATPFSLAAMMGAAADPAVMGEHRLGRRLTNAGWVVVAIVTAACAAFLARTITGGG